LEYCSFEIKDLHKQKKKEYIYVNKMGFLSQIRSLYSHEITPPSPEEEIKYFENRQLANPYANTFHLWGLL